MILMRIVVTGGAGFLGSHLCQRWLADGLPDPVNPGNPVAFTIRDLAEEASGACGREIKIAI